jgi:hypothetical protein
MMKRLFFMLAILVMALQGFAQKKTLVTDTLKVKDAIQIGSGPKVNEFSTDGTMGGNSNVAVPTEAAVKAYADTKDPSSTNEIDYTYRTSDGFSTTTPSKVTYPPSIGSVGFDQTRGSWWQGVSFGTRISLDKGSLATIAANDTSSPFTWTASTHNRFYCQTSATKADAISNPTLSGEDPGEEFLICFENLTGSQDTVTWGSLFVKRDLGNMPSLLLGDGDQQCFTFTVQTVLGAKSLVNTDGVGTGSGGSVAIPSNELPYGTGSSVTSDPDIKVIPSKNGIQSNTYSREDPVYNVGAWGIEPGADESADFLTLLNYALSHGGGIIEFNKTVSGSPYKLNQSILIPMNYTVGGIPQNVNLVIRGAGSHWTGNGQVAVSGTVIELGYTGGLPGRFMTRGSGNLEIYGITFKAPSGTTPMFHGTLTTWNVHDCSVIGHTTGGGNLDAFVLGGTTAFTLPSQIDTTASVGFQGYGTHMRDVYFDRIKTGVIFKTYANAVFLSELTFWNSCGGDYAIVVDAPADINAGNVIQNCLIELTGYEAGLYLGQRAFRTLVIGVQGFDQLIPPNKCVVKMHPSANGNYIIGAMEGGANNYMCNIPPGNRFDAVSSSDTTVWSSSFRMDASQAIHLLNNQLNIWDGVDAINLGVSNSSNAFQFKYNEAGTSTILAALSKASSTITDFYSPFFSTEFWRIYTTANMRLGVGTNKELYIGELGNPNHYFNGGTFFGGYSTGTTPFKMGQGDVLAWGDSAAPNSGTSIGLRSNSAGVLQIVNGSNNLIGALQLKTLRDSTNSSGTLNQVAISTGTGWRWGTFTGSWVGTATANLNMNGFNITGGNLATFDTTNTNLNRIVVAEIIQNNAASGTAQAQSRYYEDADNTGNNSIAIQAPSAFSSDFTQTLTPATGDIPVVLRGAANLDFPSIANGAAAELTITVTGAVNGDECGTLGVTASMNTSGLSFYAKVVSANTVTVGCVNNTGSTYDPSTGTVKVSVFK